MIKPPIEQTINLMNLGKSGNIFSDNLNVNKNIMQKFVKKSGKRWKSRI